MIGIYREIGKEQLDLERNNEKKKKNMVINWDWRCHLTKDVFVY